LKLNEYLEYIVFELKLKEYLMVSEFKLKEIS